MTTVNERDVHERLAKLADHLAANGDLRSTDWRRAFLAVRRHMFVPRYWHDDEPGAFPARWRMVDRATKDHHEWLDAVYSNRTLATELSGVPTASGDGMHPQVISSTTMPGLVIAMLEDLDVHDGQAVFEIGTGAGYNAALLCERLGDEHLTSVDIDPELIALAQVRLAKHGYRPHLITGDGSAGAPNRAPFDRIIATCGVDRIPHAWIEQTRDGGKILANLRGPFNAHALVLLTAHNGTASGHFLAQSGGFMPLRSTPEQPYDYTATVGKAEADATEGHSTLDPQTAYSNPTWGLLAQTHIAGHTCRLVYVDEDNQQLGTEISTRDGSSWARVHHTPDTHGHRTQQAGPRRLWDELEQLHEHWTTLDSPPYHRLGLTQTSSSRSLWLDHPAHAWDPPAQQIRTRNVVCASTAHKSPGDRR